MARPWLLALRHLDAYARSRVGVPEPPLACASRGPAMQPCARTLNVPSDSRSVCRIALYSGYLGGELRYAVLEFQSHLLPRGATG